MLLTPISTTENFINLYGDSIASITTIKRTDNDIVSPERFPRLYLRKVSMSEPHPILNNLRLI